ncbi:hypothetical protein Ahy_A08g038711 [Arachis hypogaea]|uniref:SWIM-type domain-containing protein n=1 Tax=Arachis hypogaea TaxID=3818 RepID=A0A445BUI2_ARAHY|nr:hypothetical protein Ahy_A08g038711 [Arachis hypogaea]
MGQEFSHEGVNSEHTSYDQYEQEEETHEEVDVDYMDEDDTNVEPVFDYHGFDEGYNIDSLEDIGMIEFWNIRDEDVCHFHFSDVDIAFEFYNRYARTRGFSARKNRTRKSRVGALKLKKFVCHRQGFRPPNNYGTGNLKRKPTPETRLTGLLPGHRFMSEADIGHMVNMKKGGISVGQIYRALANQAGDYEIDVFRQKWFEMVEGFGVENKNWVLDMYKKRHSWATAHIRGKFFAGFRTTSRCEGLNSIIAKYVNSRYNLVEFIQHFNRCVDHIRWKEVQADLASVNGRLSMQTCFQQLERSAANVYTLSIFHMFQPILVRAASMKVINMRQTGSYVIYSVGLDQTPNEMWRVFCCDIEMEFNCSCMRMESLGIPCEHIVCILVHEDIEELPRSLVLPRWTKTAKVGLQNAVGLHWDSLMLSQYGCLMDWFRQLANFACRDNERFIFTQEMAMNLLKQFKEEDAAQKGGVNDADSVRDGVQVDASGAGLATNDLGHSMPRDPRKCRTKGGLHSPIKENIDVDSVAWRATIEQLVVYMMRVLPTVAMRCCNKNRSTGELSFLTSLMNSAGSMVRVFTSLQENAPKSVVMGSAIGVDTNFTILSQILFYQKPRVTEKEKKTK